MIGQQIFLIVHIILALAIIGLILLQHGKGAEVGASFGSGASQTLFGSRGSASFLAKLTTLLAICFAITSLSMGYLASNNSSNKKSIVDTIQEVQQAAEVPSIDDTKGAARKTKKSLKTTTEKSADNKAAVTIEKTADARANADKSKITNVVTDVAEPGNLDELEVAQEIKNLEGQAKAKKTAQITEEKSVVKQDAAREKAAQSNAAKPKITNVVTDVAEPSNLDELELTQEVKTLEEKAKAIKPESKATTETKAVNSEVKPTPANDLKNSKTQVKKVKDK